jgi:hypothetical protein
MFDGKAGAYPGGAPKSAHTEGIVMALHTNIRLDKKTFKGQAMWPFWSNKKKFYNIALGNHEDNYAHGILTEREGSVQLTSLHTPASFQTEKYVYFFTKQPILIRSSTVLSLSLQ